MGKALSFPQHRHAPSTLEPAFKLRIGALSNDQGTEAPASEDGETGHDQSMPGPNDEVASQDAPGAELPLGE